MCESRNQDVDNRCRHRQSPLTEKAKMSADEKVESIVQRAEKGSLAALRMLNELVTEFGGESSLLAGVANEQGIKFAHLSFTEKLDSDVTRRFLRTNALRIFGVAQWHLRNLPALPPSGASYKWFENTIGALSFASHLFEAAGKWINVRNSVDRQTELILVVSSAMERLRMLYELLARAGSGLLLGSSATEMVATASSMLHLMLVTCASKSAIQEIKVRHCDVAIPFAFFLWDRHAKSDDADDVSLAADYLRFVSFEPNAHDIFRDALTQASVDSEHCALSFVSVLRRAFKLDLHTDNRMKMLLYIFNFLIACTDVRLSPSRNFRDALRKSGANIVASSMLVEIKDDFHQCLRIDRKEYRSRLGSGPHIEVFGLCLQFLRLNFDEYDGELWAIGPLRRGLLRKLFSVEVMLPRVPFLTFRSYQWMLYRLIVLARSERFHKVLLEKLLRIWKKEGQALGSSDQQLFENEFNRTALIRRLSQTHKSPFRLICTNPTCVASDASRMSPLRCCGGCKSVHYCSRECQKMAWALHKKCYTQIAEEGPLTALSHTDRANCIAYALYEYEQYLDTSGIKGGNDKIERSHAIVAGATEPFRYAQRRSFGDQWKLLALGYDKNGSQFVSDKAFKPRSLDDNEAWASAPALGRYLRECITERLTAGLADQILVECKRHDGQFRERGAPATFYALVYMPWRDVFRIVNTKNVTRATLFLQKTVRQNARNPKFEEHWMSGAFLDYALDKRSTGSVFEDFMEKDMGRPL